MRLKISTNCNKGVPQKVWDGHNQIFYLSFLGFQLKRFFFYLISPTNIYLTPLDALKNL
jgi:hypothetical protein